MKRQPLYKRVLQLATYSILLLVLQGALSADEPSANTNDRFSEALVSYRQGEKAKDVESRKRDFNRALSLYLDLEKSNSSGELFYNIGNCFYQLGEYGQAIYYYKKAENLSPRDSRIKSNLKMALQKADVAEAPANNWMAFLLFIHTDISQFEKQVLIGVILALIFLFLTFYVWFPLNIYRTVTRLLFFGLAILSLSLIWDTYFAPIEAIAIQPVTLKKAPGEEYASLPIPCLPGTTLEVLYTSPDGKWIKVKTNRGQEGYVSSDAVKIL